MLDFTVTFRVRFVVRFLAVVRVSGLELDLGLHFRGRASVGFRYTVLHYRKRTQG